MGLANSHFLRKEGGVGETIGCGNVGWIAASSLLVFYVSFVICVIFVFVVFFVFFVCGLRTMSGWGQGLAVGDFGPG